MRSADNLLLVCVFRVAVSVVADVNIAAEAHPQGLVHVSVEERHCDVCTTTGRPSQNTG